MDGVPSQMVARVRGEQMNSLSIIAGVMSVMGLGTICLANFEFYNLATAFFAFTASLLIVICYVRVIVLGLRWHLSAGPDFRTRNAERMRRQFVRTMFVLGSAWGAFFVELMRYAHDNSRALLYALIIGLMSSSALFAPASAALAFWLPITTAALIAFAFVSESPDLAVTLLLIVYAFLTLFCLVYLNRGVICRIQGEIRQSEGRETIGLLLRDFEESVSDWLWETDENGRLTYVSARFAQVARKGLDELLGVELSAVLGLTQGGVAAGPVRRATDQPNLVRCIEQRLPFRDVEVLVSVGAETVCWSLTGKPKLNARSAFEGYRGVGSDVTQSMRAKDRARFLAHYDELTGLANRRLFREVLKTHCSEAKARPIALLCVDLDRFKAVNDAHGHAVGDSLLVAVARRLETHFLGDHLCGRLGGDEFAITLRDAEPAMVANMADRLVARLSMPYQVEGFQVEVGATIGVAFASSNLTSSTALLRNADTALYQAKMDGRGRTRFYDRELSDRDLYRSKMQAELRSAIDNNRLHLLFQPIVSLDDGLVSAVEALVRWDHPVHGLLGAGEFVPLAESCGLIDSLGEFMLTRACQEGRLLPSTTTIAVNVSPLQLHGRRFIAHLRKVLADTGFSPTRLELELTETALFEMSAQTFALLKEISQLGIRINLDDFGVGHTSLGQLRKFPFNTLKIDQSFTHDMPSNSSARVIVRGLASMAAELGIRTVAEGIETPEQLQLVREAGCDDAQGFFLAPPMSAPDISRFVNSRINAQGLTRATKAVTAG